MATSSFKSTTRRSNPDPKKPSKKKPIRRSQSVSAVSRVTQSELGISEFQNKRDNPLFCSDVPDPKLSRPENSGNKKAEAGRRGRSVSRQRYAPSQSEAEQDYAIPSSYRNQNLNVPASRMKKGTMSDNVPYVHRATVRKQSTELSVSSALNSSYSEEPWEDAVSTGYLTEAEEKTIKAVYEQIKGDYVDGAVSHSNGIYETIRSEVRRAILDIQKDVENALQRNNTHAMAATNVADISPDLVNPGAVELVADIRKQYAKKLEESHERATKLRADLAVEEHRGQEFSRILKEIIPDLKTKSVQQSWPGRKRSNERKNMSKRLTEGAMAYFDECVSISTFDSSDFSASEDAPFNLLEVSTPVGPTASLAQDSSSVPTSYCANSSLDHNQDSNRGLFMNRHMDSGLTASSGSNEPVINRQLGRKSRFSFSQKPTENGELQQDIRSYIKNNENEYVETTHKLETSRSIYHDMDLYMHVSGESLLLEMVLSKNRMESGSLHLCGGGLAIVFPPFASIL